MLFFDPDRLCRYEAMFEARSTSNKIEHLQPSLNSVKINCQDLIQLSLYINSCMYDSPKSRKFLPLIHSLFHVLLPKAQTVRDELPAVDDRKLEGTVQRTVKTLTAAKALTTIL